MNRERIDAMAASTTAGIREVYFDFPEIPSFGERWRALFHHRLV
jgi:hypothetical protein